MAVTSAFGAFERSYCPRILPNSRREENRSDQVVGVRVVPLGVGVLPTEPGDRIDVGNHPGDGGRGAVTSIETECPDHEPTDLGVASDPHRLGRRLPRRPG